MESPRNMFRLVSDLYRNINVGAFAPPLHGYLWQAGPALPSTEVLLPPARHSQSCGAPPSFETCSMARKSEASYPRSTFQNCRRVLETSEKNRKPLQEQSARCLGHELRSLLQRLLLLLARKSIRLRPLDLGVESTGKLCLSDRCWGSWSVYLEAIL